MSGGVPMEESLILKSVRMYDFVYKSTNNKIDLLCERIEVFIGSWT